MNTQSKKAIILTVGAIALIAVSAGAAAYVTRSQIENPNETKKVVAQSAPVKKTVKKEQITWNEPRPQPAPQPVQQQCDDGNIVGAGIGAAAGGLIGHQFGSGKGKDLATIGGAIVGGTAGHQYIPTRGTLCR